MTYSAKPSYAERRKFPTLPWQYYERYHYREVFKRGHYLSPLLSRRVRGFFSTARTVDTMRGSSAGRKLTTGIVRTRGSSACVGAAHPNSSIRRILGSTATLSDRQGQTVPGAKPCNEDHLSFGYFKTANRSIGLTLSRNVEQTFCHRFGLSTFSTGVSHRFLSCAPRTHCNANCEDKTGSLLDCQTCVRLAFQHERGFHCRSAYTGHSGSRRKMGPPSSCWAGGRQCRAGRPVGTTWPNRDSGLLGNRRFGVGMLEVAKHA
jgi:hypothetical protein